MGATLQGVPRKAVRPLTQRRVLQQVKSQLSPLLLSLLLLLLLTLLLLTLVQPFDTSYGP
jgi:hypothetical protein